MPTEAYVNRLNATASSQSKLALSRALYAGKSHSSSRQLTLGPPITSEPRIDVELNGRCRERHLDR